MKRKKRQIEYYKNQDLINSIRRENNKITFLWVIIAVSVIVVLYLLINYICIL